MKFSYSIIKKALPQVKSITDLAEKLSFHLFEVESVSSDILDLKILPNRYSDAASYWGLESELAAIFKIKHPRPEEKVKKIKHDIDDAPTVVIKTQLCNRLTARYFKNVKIGPSPKWLQEALAANSQKSINNLVDITNYVTMETGQPTHVFDADKMDGEKLIVRAAQKDERLTTLDNRTFELHPPTLVLADDKDALDIAGVKGGKKAEVGVETKNILLTVGNFDGTSIYQTSHHLNLITDASIRFSHNLSPALVDLGIHRASELIKELCGSQAGLLVDDYPRPAKSNLIEFDLERFNGLSGLNLDLKTAKDYLSSLGFAIKSVSKKAFLVKTPLIRNDVSTFEDLAEEIMRLYGYQHLTAQPPHVFLRPSGYEDNVRIKELVRNCLSDLGLDEVYNYSFSSNGEINILNPTNEKTPFLRTSLKTWLLKNVEDNFRFFDQVKIFEIGKVFHRGAKNKFVEDLMLGIAIAAKKTDYKNNHPFLELKGVVDQLLESLGLTDYFFKPSPQSSNELRLEADHHVLGYLKDEDRGVTIAEINADELLKLVEEEHSYEPLPKYPSITRDVSLWVNADIRVSEILSTIQNTSPKYLDDVDLIDFYDEKAIGEDKKSLTFRLVFLAPDRTLTDKEVDQEIDKVTKALIADFDAEVR